VRDAHACLAAVIFAKGNMAAARQAIGYLPLKAISP
jgi:hypothetical protein